MAATWTVWIEGTQPAGTSERVELAIIGRDVSTMKADELGLRLTEAESLLRGLQSFLSQDQVRRLSAAERTCHSCGSHRALHDYRSR